MRSLLASLVILLTATHAPAALILDVESVTDDSITFSMTGTLTGSEPTSADFLALLGGGNWLVTTSQETATHSPGQFVNTSDIVNIYSYANFLGGDRLHVTFDADLVADVTQGTGTAITVTLGGAHAFDWAALVDSELTLAWGASGLSFGPEQSTATVPAVPEPATGVLVLAAASVFALARRRAA